METPSSGLSQSTIRDCSSNKVFSLEVHRSTQKRKDTATKVDSQNFAVNNSTTPKDRGQGNISSSRPEPHSELFNSMSYDVVAQRFEDAFYQSAAESSQDVARGFEDVFHHAVGESCYGDISQGLRDTFCRPAQCISNYQNVARGFESSFYQTPLAYQDEVRGFEDGFFQWRGAEL
ncbi:hypothetical protein BDV33DRAFT_185265 [Aspergillus novoparasiticus]|uniref:Uncharacterized protein n=1 Tax=Aspergillus novoparasiticus TaxID=986946 RepID=A0A5N6E9T8_9EURO|nr:hypothetical protein BDV33DRAFT_185265 [Aspergillus novoparasiticus]